jgi:hypothetical protein
MFGTMANSLDLDPEWGAIDLLQEVEAAFGIEIANEEAERCCTVGDLYDVLCAHSPEWDNQDGSCASSMVFYRLRRSLSPADKRGFVPDTPLTASGLQPSRLFKKLADDSGLRLPAYELTWLGITGGFLLVGGFLTAIVALLAGHWIVSGAVALIGLAGLPLLRLDPGRFPAGMVTLADLVRGTSPLNVARLKEAGGRPADRWSVLVALAAEHGALSPDEIDPETFFHRRSLEVATAR